MLALQRSRSFCWTNKIIICIKKYIRHYANILDTVHTLLQEAQVGYEDAKVHVAITGSGGMANG